MNDTLVAIDIGYGETKIAMPNLGTPSCKSFRSIAEPMRNSDAGLGSGFHKRDTFRVLVNGKRYEVGRDAALNSLSKTVPVLHDDYIGTTDYQAFLHAALYMVKQPNIGHLVTGLPVSHMTKQRDALIELLTGHHQVTADFSVDIDRVYVIPQPLGGLIDYATTRDQSQPVREMTVLVIDPGQYTTDWLVADRLRGVRGRSGSLGTGMADVVAATSEILVEEFGGAPNEVALAEALKTGNTVRVHGKPTDIRSAVERAAQNVTEPVIRALKNSVEHFRDIDLILLVGGGAPVFQPAVKALVANTRLEVAVPRSPALANVRGYYVYGEKMASSVMRAVR